MSSHKILWGVCGIGNGHTQRQLPLIEHFSKQSQIVIFAYDSSYEFFTKHFKDNKQITVIPVAVPFYVGNKEGIDFEATKNLEKNHKDFDTMNNQAKVKAEALIGKPDLVITDYEPVSAQYAYEHDTPLVTIDQQSKYLVGDFPKELNGQTYADEVARLKMFFPKADARLACSFFDVTKLDNKEEVLMFPPVLKDSILTSTNAPITPTSILVYFSSQQEFPQSLNEVINICTIFPQVNFHIFSPKLYSGEYPSNINLHEHGDQNFQDILQSCAGIVSTAGHGLLSEAMYLNIPVYAIPLPVYEQHMNAEVIGQNKFGIKSQSITKVDLNTFINNISLYRNNIKTDQTVLLKGDGKQQIINYLQTKFL